MNAEVFTLGYTAIVQYVTHIQCDTDIIECLAKKLSNMALDFEALCGCDGVPQTARGVTCEDIDGELEHGKMEYKVQGSVTVTFFSGEGVIWRSAGDHLDD